MRTIRIALTGDLASNVVAHRAIPRALQLAAAAVGCGVDARWVPTTDLLPDAASVLDSFDGHWCVPGSPYASEEGALAGIADSRANGRPYLGTCAGFQHALLEYARNVAGIRDAAHEETNPQAATPLVSHLACDLVEREEWVRFTPGSRMAQAYGRLFAREGYHCSYGLNPEYREALERAGLAMTAYDAAGAVRGLEIPGHPFFLAALFQPERSALAEPRPHPLIAAFVEAARVRATGGDPHLATGAAAAGAPSGS